VTVKEAAQLRPWASERWLRRAIFEHRIAYHKLGSGRGARVLVDLDDLDRYAEQGRIEPARRSS
jgi:hypothetical protein